MGNVGLPAHFVDTQDVSLTNLSDVNTYLQLTDITFDIDSTVEKNQISDDQIDNVFSLYMNGIEGNMRVTTPQWSDLVTLTIDVNGVRPIKTWQVKWIDSSGSITSTSFNGQLKTLRPIDAGLGVVNLFFRIEVDEAVAVG